MKKLLSLTVIAGALVATNAYSATISTPQAHALDSFSVQYGLAAGDTYTRSTTAYGIGATGGGTNFYGNDLKAGMIAIAPSTVTNGLYSKIFPNGKNDASVKTFVLPDGTKTKGVKVLVDGAYSPYTPTVKKAAKYEAVICDVGAASAFKDDHIDIYFPLKEKDILDYSMKSVKFTILDQSVSTVHATVN